MNASMIKGFGFRMQLGGSTLEGDLVETLADGERWIDLKFGPGGNYSLEELGRVEQALADGHIREFVFSHDAASSPPAWWQAEVAAINARLAQGLRPIQVVGGGTLP